MKSKMTSSDLPVSSALVLTRAFAWSVAMLSLTFLINNYLTFWQGWPGVLSGAAGGSSDVSLNWQGYVQWVSYLATVFFSVAWVLSSKYQSAERDVAYLSSFSAYLVRAAFWGVMLVGLADVAISLMRVEGWLVTMVGDEVASALVRPQYRGEIVHLPLVLAGFVLALVIRGLSFVWLCLLIVIMELLIVIFRFVFSYEQVFMGDLVRFWYAALFLFASAYTFVADGHVRVDVLYASLSDKVRAKMNVIGVLLLGLPFCWAILLSGMWSKGSSINSPLLSVEISQSGFGLYVKYLMVGFLIVFAVTMIFQFCAYLIQQVALLTDKQSDQAVENEESQEGSEQLSAKTEGVA